MAEMLPNSGVPGEQEEVVGPRGGPRLALVGLAVCRGLLSPSSSPDKAMVPPSRTMASPGPSFVVACSWKRYRR